MPHILTDSDEERLLTKRVAIDKLKLSTPRTVTHKRYAWLVKAAINKKKIKLLLKSRSRKKTVELRAIASGSKSLTFRSTNNGVELVVARPSKDTDPDRTQPGVSLTINGRVFSSRVRGLSLVHQYMRAIARLLFEDLHANLTRRTELVLADMKVRELHLAFDVVASSNQYATVHESIYAGSNVREAGRRFKSKRTHKGRIDMSKPNGGKAAKDEVSIDETGDALTLTIGKAPRLVIYERDRKPDHLKQLRRVWRRLGVSEDHRVLRAEFQLTYAALAGIKLEGKAVGQLPLPIVLNGLRTIACVLVDRVVHLKSADQRKRANPRLSAFWSAVTRGCDLLDEPVTGSLPADADDAEVKAKRLRRWQRQLDRAAIQLVDEHGQTPTEVIRGMANAIGVTLPEETERALDEVFSPSHGSAVTYAGPRLLPSPERTEKPADGGKRRRAA